MLIIDKLPLFFLFFDNLQWIACYILMGFIFINRTLFYHATCILCISIIFNVALKCTFQIPLLPTVHHPGFAFPSGHMQLATVFYGWLGLHTRHHKLHLLIITLLSGIGFGLVYLGYHTWFDVLGAVFFAGLIIGLYQILLLQKIKFLNMTWTNLSITSLAMLYIAYRYTIPSYAWFAFSTLVICIIAASKKACVHNRI
jgi:undecaprenyl-diphosphatase